ncbi:MAG TPA: hypothetical protein G4O02_14345 [Caldilineae bacterium]|jgi:uncharacterized membrane protein YesL|nr:hypothetical protein [Caldilineae bacterium]
MSSDELPILNRETYIPTTFRQVWENLPKLLLAGLLFAIYWGPALSLALLGLWGPAFIVSVLILSPGWAALLAFEADFSLDRHARFRVMFTSFRRLWKRGVGLGLLASFPLVAAWLSLPVLSRPQAPIIVWWGLAADALALLLLVVLSLYAFPLLALYDVSLYLSLRNAMILASRHILNTLGLLAMGVLFALAVLYISPGLLFILPPVWGIFILNNCKMLVDEEMREDSGGRNR